MIKILGSIPNKVSVALSGGSDSMAALDFIRNNGRRNVLALHFNHKTSHSNDAEEFVTSYCNNNSIPLVVGEASRGRLSGESKEEYWRNQRYEFFNNYFEKTLRECTKVYNISNDDLSHFFYSQTPIVTCHHLDDVIETWIFTSLNGNPMLIPYKRDSFIRPFLGTSKNELVEWAEKRLVPYISDPSNEDNSYMRNFIRNDLVSKCRVVNPGLSKTLRKKVLSYYNNDLLSF